MNKRSLSAAAVLAALSLSLAAPAYAGWFDHWIQAYRVDQIITNVQLDNVEEQYTKYYAEDAQFNDPTVTVEGRDAIIAHLQEALNQVTIDDVRVTDTLHNQDGTWMVTYEMDSRLLAAPGLPVGETFTLIAATVLKFDDDNRVVYHRDYWDQFAAFQQIPDFNAQVFGGIVGPWIASQVGAPPPSP